jgi:hypothetical protein
MAGATEIRRKREENSMAGPCARRYRSRAAGAPRHDSVDAACKRRPDGHGLERFSQEDDYDMNTTGYVRPHAGLLGLIALSLAAAAVAGESDSEAKVQRGFAIAPVALNLAGKNRALVGLGSYIVNSGGCNDCHTHPAFAAGGDPYANQPEQVNTAQYLSGGRAFGPFVSANLTPDASGNPAGLTFGEFVEAMRNGQVPDNPPGVVLQVMPWPAFGKMTDRDLAAIYEYLRAVPSLPDNPTPGP